MSSFYGYFFWDMLGTEMVAVLYGLDCLLGKVRQAKLM